MNIRHILASAASTVILLAPGCVALLYDQNPGPLGARDSWQHGAVLLPVFFVAISLACLTVGQSLLSKGCRSMRTFTSQAVLASAAAAILVSTPAAIIGYVAGLFTVQTALSCVAAFVGLLTTFTVPASAVWWFVAGVNGTKASEAVS